MNPDAPHFVYRVFDANDYLLYVGCTHDMKFRMREHRRTKPAWLAEMGRVETEMHPNRTTALEAERVAIVLERPSHNVAYSHLTASHLQATA